LTDGGQGEARLYATARQAAAEGHALMRRLAFALAAIVLTLAGVVARKGTGSVIATHPGSTG